MVSPRAAPDSKGDHGRGAPPPASRARELAGWPLGERVTLRQFMLFAAVAKAGSLAKAARLVGVSEPAVSQQIKALSASVGHPLIEYNGRRMLLTEAGGIVHDYASRLLSLVDELGEVLDDHGGARSGSLKIGATSNISVYFLPSLLARFRDAHSGLRPSVSTASPRHLEEELLARSIDVALLETPPAHPALEVIPWRSEPLGVIVSPVHPWATRSDVTPAELTQVGFLTGEPGSGTQRALREGIGDIADHFPVALQLGATEAVKRGVEANLGVSIVMHHCVRQELNTGALRWVPIAGSSPHKTLCIVRVRGRHQSTAVRAFIGLVLDSEP